MTFFSFIEKNKVIFFAMFVTNFFLEVTKKKLSKSQNVPPCGMYHKSLFIRYTLVRKVLHFFTNQKLEKFDFKRSLKIRLIYTRI